MAVLADTSAVLALADASDVAHAAVRAAVAAERERFIVIQPALAEIAYLVGARRGGGAEVALLRTLIESEWLVEPLREVDLARAVDLLERYRDARLGFVDASMISVAERLRVRRIYTLDRRDFGMVRPVHIDAFELLP